MTEDSLLEELRLADPAPVDATRPEGAWSSATVLQTIERRSGTMQVSTQKTETLIPRPQRRRRLVAAVAALALVIAAAGTVIAIVGGPDGSDAAANPPLTTFTGDACVYEGPAEFGLNDRVTFTFVNATSDSGWAFELWAVPEGTTAADISERGILDIVLANGGDLSGSIGGVGFPTSQGVVEPLTRTLKSPGQHAIVCVEAPERDTQFASLFTVSGN